ncbi:uncharacterized protein [Ptychodera flava]|uniref:uncharacterized protein n=1 Tax=Ptychodera flava TaxID=63121 RepID=UPI00396A72E0
MASKTPLVLCSFLSLLSAALQVHGHRFIYDTPCYKSGYREVTTGYAMGELDEGDVLVLEDVSSQNVCFDQCMLTDWCLSINYRKFTKVCQLNAQDKLSLPGNYGQQGGYVYADFRSGVLDEKYLGSCASSPCLNGGSCRVDCLNTTQYYCLCPPYYSGPQCESMTMYPIGLWPLNEAYGAKDATEYGNDGGVTGVSLTTGPNGETNGAYYFTGSTGSYMEISNDGSLDTEYSITMLLWVYPESSEAPLFHFYPASWGVYLWQIATTELHCRFTFRDGSTPTTLVADVLTLNEWHYVGASYDYNTGLAKLWYNGEDVDVQDIGIKTLRTNYNIRVGYQGHDNRVLKGRVSCLQLYDRALSGDEIMSVKDCPSPVTMHLVGLWPLNGAYGYRDAMDRRSDGSMTSTSLVTGPNGETQGAHYFSGTTGSYMEIPNDGTLNVQYSMTMLAWILPEATDGPVFHFGPSDWKLTLWQMSTNTLYVRFVFQDGSNVELTADVLIANAWNYVGASYNYNTGVGRLWLNGVEVASQDIGVKTMSANTNVRVAYQGSDNRIYQGRIFCLQLYSRALSAAEILSVKNCPIPD